MSEATLAHNDESATGLIVTQDETNETYDITVSTVQSAPVAVSYSEFLALFRTTVDAPLLYRVMHKRDGRMKNETELSIGDRSCSDCYFTVQPGGRTNKEISHVVALFIDVDAKDERVAKDSEGKAIIPDFALEPTAIVRSGSGGFHAYWLLSEAVPPDAAWFKAHQLALANAFDGDRNVHDLARIMRLPGSYNWKSGEPKPCEIVSWNPENRYTPSDIVARLELALEAPAAKKTAAKKTVAKPTAGGSRTERIASEFASKLRDSDPGTRNNTLYHISCEAHQKYGSNTSLIEHIEEECFKIWSEFLGKADNIEVSDFQTTWASGAKSDRANSVPYGTVTINGQEVEAHYSQKSGRLIVSSDLVKACLCKSGLWHNEMSGRVMMGRKAFDDTDLVVLAQMCRETLGQLKIDRIFVLEMVQEVAIENKRHPFREFVDSLTPQEHPEVIYELMDSYGISEVSMKGLLLGFSQTIAGVLDPNVAMELMVVLISEKHGTGKTKFLNTMLTLGSDLTPLSADFPKESDKDSILNSMGHTAHIIDECGKTLRESCWNNTKAILSKRVHQLRPPYGRGTKEYRRDFSYWGATNDMSILADTMNRRIIPVEFTRSSVMDGKQDWLDLAQLRKAFWEHAFFLYKQNPTLLVPDDVYKQMNDADYRALPDGAECIDALPWNGKSYTLEDIRSKLDQMNTIQARKVLSYSDHKLGALLKALGWRAERKRVDGKLLRVWFPPSC